MGADCSAGRAWNLCAGGSAACRRTKTPGGNRSSRGSHDQRRGARRFASSTSRSSIAFRAGGSGLTQARSGRRTDSKTAAPPALTDGQWRYGVSGEDAFHVRPGVLSKRDDSPPIWIISGRCAARAAGISFGSASTEKPTSFVTRQRSNAPRSSMSRSGWSSRLRKLGRQTGKVHRPQEELHKLLDQVRVDVPRLDGATGQPPS